MKLEVDNVTEQLVRDLEASISVTIEGLYRGQKELTDLIREVRDQQRDLAPSDQVDEVHGLVREVSADIKAAASARQVGAAADEVKALLADAQKNLAGIQNTQRLTLEDTKALLSAQAGLEAGLQSVTLSQENAPQATAALLEDRLQVLLTLEEKFDSFSAQLDAQKDELLRCAQNALDAARRNQTSLDAIMAYLSLPGYKRFFKGMEVPADEAPV